MSKKCLVGLEVEYLAALPEGLGSVPSTVGPLTAISNSSSGSLFCNLWVVHAHDTKNMQAKHPYTYNSKFLENISNGSG